MLKIIYLREQENIYDLEYLTKPVYTSDENDMASYTHKLGSLLNLMVSVNIQKNVEVAVRIKSPTAMLYFMHDN